jgi:Protein of unknown function (DUF4240)
MATILKVNIHDLNSQFFYDLGQKISDAVEIEIRIPEKKSKIEIFSDTDFWHIISLFDWSKKESAEIMAPAIKKLAAMPVVNIYLFADKLAEKLHQLDTRAHGKAYLKNEDDNYLSVDDFLYIRCAVVAEGKAYFDKVLQNPSEFPADLSFEPILNLPDQAYELKTGRTFEYAPTVSYETYSNTKAW